VIDRAGYTVNGVEVPAWTETRVEQAKAGTTSRGEAPSRGSLPPGGRRVRMG
jgi:hypothetical protein